jgi:hypothetical protein
MTYYDLYKKIATYIDAEWTQTPMFMKGEVISIPAPYVVLDLYGIGQTSGSCKSPVIGGKLSCYGANRGKTHKLVSDVHEQFKGKIANGIKLENVRIESPITILEDDLFFGIVKFTARG